MCEDRAPSKRFLPNAREPWSFQECVAGTAWETRVCWLMLLGGKLQPRWRSHGLSLPGQRWRRRQQGAWDRRVHSEVTQAQMGQGRELSRDLGALARVGLFFDSEFETGRLWEKSPRSIWEDQLRGPGRREAPLDCRCDVAEPSVMYAVVSGGAPHLSAHQKPLGFGGWAGRCGSVVWSIGS